MEYCEHNYIAPNKSLKTILKTDRLYLNLKFKKNIWKELPL